MTVSLFRIGGADIVFYVLTTTTITKLALQLLQQQNFSNFSLAGAESEAGLKASPKLGSCCVNQLHNSVCNLAFLTD